jgi:hypothetical protein
MWARKTIFVAGVLVGSYLIAGAALPENPRVEAGKVALVTIDHPRPEKSVFQFDGTRTAYVKFEKKWSRPPHVVACDSNSGGWCIVKVQDVTTEGFRVVSLADRSLVYAPVVTWIAVE